MNLSFHLENNFSCWTHMTPFLTQESLPRRLELGIPAGEECSDVSVTEGALTKELGPLLADEDCVTEGRCLEKSNSVTALEPRPTCEESLRSLPSSMPWVLMGAPWPKADGTPLDCGWWNVACWLLFWLIDCWETARGILKHIRHESDQAVVSPPLSLVQHAGPVNGEHHHHQYQHTVIPNTTTRWMKLQILLITLHSRHQQIWSFYATTTTTTTIVR